MTIHITLPPESAALLQRVQQWPRALTRAVMRALDQENWITVGHIQEKRARGKGPFPPSEGKLGHRSGRYAKSLWASKPVESGGSIISAIGTNIRYAGVHEYGFDGTVQVRAHTRRFFGKFQTGGVAFFDSRTGKIRKSKKRTIELQTGSVEVKAHQMHMRMPARAPIRRGIEDRLDSYGPALSRAIVDALQSPA